MANEYLQRTPTSTGNQRVFTISVWIKRNASGIYGIFGAGDGASAINSDHLWLSSDYFAFSAQDGTNFAQGTSLLRDVGSWTHYHYIHNTDNTTATQRSRFFINGVDIKNDTTYSASAFTINQVISWMNKAGAGHAVGARNRGGYTSFMKGEMADFFFVDGQALTPDVFGKYIKGNGYISAGSTQSTDFRKGQWVPKAPRIIKSVINARGGFGVNGFYLPMNSSTNFGADFHCDPNSIIKLNEELAQPKVGIATTATVGLGYTDALRADPYAANLVLALPFVSGGLTTGTDYAPYIKGSGTAKTITNNGVSIASTASHYGSAAFFNGSTQYLSIADSDDFNFGSGNFTIECWINPSTTVNTTSYRRILSQQQLVGGGNWIFRLDNQGVFQTNFYDGSNSVTLTTGARIDTLGQWTHIAVVRNGNTLANYINGVCAGIATNMSITIPDISATIEVGRYIGGSEYYVGYLQDLRVYKGVAKYTGGFDVPRPYTPVGIATWRAVPDTTANNFCTWNPLYPTIAGSNATYTNGNLTVSDPTSNGSQVSATIGVSTGKWYYEAVPTVTNSASNLIGIRPAEWFTFNSQNRTSYRNNGDVYNDAGTTVQSGTTYTSNDIIGVAIDMNNRRLWFSKNGSFVYGGNPDTGSNGVSFASTYTHYTPAVMFDNQPGTEVWTANFGQNPTFSGNTTAGTFTDSNGKGLFKYQPPSGFLALCEDNLPTPAISDPGKHFKTVLYTGDGNNGRSIVGVGFTPDLVWIKNRNTTNNHNLYDSVRGPNIGLFSDLTIAELNYNIPPDGPQNRLLSFDNDGISIGSPNAINGSGNSIVAWCWRAGAGTTSTNTNGSITSVVSVNQDAGFSIVSWTGNGSSTATVGHGLGKVPAFLISKARGTTNDWWVVHKSGNGNLQLNTTVALVTSGGTNGAMGFPSTLTSSTFTFTNGSSSVNNVNQNGITYVSYCWTEVEGFSKFGSYVGTGATDGPFVYCGFKPAFVMTKNTSSSSNWLLWDSSKNSNNPSNFYQILNNNLVDQDTGADIDFLSNGFKVRNTSTSGNGSGATIIFAAFAESPFKTANAK